MFPIGIVALVLSGIYLRESRSPSALKLDIPGALLLGAVLFALIFPISEGRERGFPAWSWAMMGAALLLGYVWVGFERNLARAGGSPLVPMELFESKGYGRGLTSILLLFSGLSSTSFVIGQFLQRGLGLAPKNAGLVFGALSLSFLVSSLGSAKMVARIGTKTLLVGLTLLQIGQVLLIAATFFLRGHLHAIALVPILFVYGLGQGLCVPQIIRQTMKHGRNAKRGARLRACFRRRSRSRFSLGVSVVGGIFFAIGDPKAQGNPDSWALGTAAAFACNFVFVLMGTFARGSQPKKCRFSTTKERRGGAGGVKLRGDG